MKKSLLITTFLLLFLIPVLAFAQAPFVTCGNPGQAPCGINDFFITLGRIYNFIVLYLATPLAIIGLLAGGIMLMASGGNPGLAGKAKQVLLYSIIGLILAFGSWLIIRTILIGIGYKYAF